MLRTVSVLAATIVLLSGCAYPSPGRVAADIPPQLVQREGLTTWDKPGAFGPVPAEQAERGSATCASLNSDKLTFEARGFHPRAMNLQGQPFPAGGFFCTPKS